MGHVFPFNRVLSTPSNPPYPRSTIIRHVTLLNVPLTPRGSFIFAPVVACTRKEKKKELAIISRGGEEEVGSLEEVLLPLVIRRSQFFFFLFLFRFFWTFDRCYSNYTYVYSFLFKWNNPSAIKLIRHWILRKMQMDRFDWIHKSNETSNFNKFLIRTFKNSILFPST